MSIPLITATGTSGRMQAIFIFLLPFFRFIGSLRISPILLTFLFLLLFSSEDTIRQRLVPHNFTYLESTPSNTWDRFGSSTQFLHTPTTLASYGINTSTPDEAVHVVGNHKVQGNIIVSGTVDGVDVSALKTTVDGLSGGGSSTGAEFWAFYLAD